MEESLIKEEYARLCNEIAKNAEMSFQLMIACVTATGGLIGYGIQSLDKVTSYIFIIPFFVTTPSLLMLSSQLRSTYRIGSYIGVFLERKDKNCYWENRLCELKNPSIFKGTPRHRVSYLVLFSILITICFILFTTNSKSLNLVFWIVFTSCLIINFFALKTYIQATSSKVKKAFIEEWKKVKQNEIDQ